MIMNSSQIPFNTIFIHCHPGTTETLDMCNSYNVVQTANGTVFEARLDSTDCSLKNQSQEHLLYMHWYYSHCLLYLQPTTGTHPKTYFKIITRFQLNQKLFMNCQLITTLIFFLIPHSIIIFQYTLCSTCGQNLVNVSTIMCMGVHVTVLAINAEICK